MTQRRLLLLALGASLSGHAPLLCAQAAAAGLRRVGVLAPRTRAKEDIILKPFFDQMRELGWVERQNIAYDWACADDQMAMLPRLAAELVAPKPELIYAPPTPTPAAVAAKQATQTIPIVFGAVADPVGIGLVTSLARRGGNVTGMSSSVAESLVPKRVQLLREILPRVKRVGLLGDSNDPATKSVQHLLAPLAAPLGLTIIVAVAGKTEVYAPVPEPKTKKDKQGNAVQQDTAPDKHQPKPGDSEAVASWRKRMAGEEAKELYKQRAATAECVNAQARNRGLLRMPVRGLAKVRCVVGVLSR